MKTLQDKKVTYHQLCYTTKLLHRLSDLQRLLLKKISGTTYLVIL